MLSNRQPLLRPPFRAESAERGISLYFAPLRREIPRSARNDGLMLFALPTRQFAYIKWLLVAFFAAISPLCSMAQQNSTLASAIQKVIDRPEFKHANFGIEFYDLANGTVIYSLNADKLFTPASTTKLLTEGAVLAKFGKDYRFHTAIYRIGPVDKKGRLKADLILVASADPNLSNRIQPENTLAFQAT